MMKKRKFGSGGMPSMKESMESGNRVSRQVGAETKKLMPATRSTRPSVGDAIASGNRMSKKNAEDLKAVKKYAKGGNVKRYADGDLAMSGAAVDLEAAARRGENLRELDRMDTSVSKIEAPAKKQSFSAAFAAARKRGDKTFTWNGGSYGTKMKGEGDKPATRGMSDAQIRKFMSDNDRAADRSLATKPATSGMSDAEIRKFMSDNDRAANRSLDDTKIRKYMQGLNADADRSLAAMKAKKEAKMASDIGKATTASLSAAASRAIPRTPGMPMKSGAGKPATSGMSDAEIRKFMRDNERGYEETAARKTPNPIRRVAEATGTAAKRRLVEPKYAKGGSVTRADGCAVRGKTKGKMV